MDFTECLPRKNMFIPQYEQESYSYNYDLVSSHNLLYN